MVDNYASTLLIKVSPEMKGAFQGLCKARGVSVSAELRRFMADQLNDATGNMGTPKEIDDPRSVTPKRIKTTRKAPTSPSSATSVPKRDSQTPDLFDLKTPQNARRATVKPSKVGKHKKGARKATEGQYTLHSAIAAAMSGKK